MKTKPLLSMLTAIVLGIVPAGQHGQGAAVPPPPTSAEITAGELRRHVEYLASDELRGRETGTPEAVRAARYLARALAAAGTTPAGDDGTFLQAVPLERIAQPEPARLFLTAKNGEAVEAAYGIDFTAYRRGAPCSTGRLVLRSASRLEEMPATAAAGEALFVDGSSRERKEWFAARDMGEGEGWGMVLRAGSRRPGRAPRSPRATGGRLQPVRPGEVPGPLLVTVRGPLRERLRAGEFTAVRLESFAVREQITDHNVVARIDGVGTPARPDLADEVIVLSAHFDHLGVREPRGDDTDEDRIYNGADDDASGTAAVLELAQAFAAGPPPARTLVFLCATGEEKGLLGTSYYLDHPALPLARTVLNLNFEMIGRPDALSGGFGKLWLTGFERTTLGPALREHGCAVVADQRPEENFFQRSDNYAFARRGIVAQTLSSYDLHDDYHRVTDEVDTLDFEHMEAAVRSAYAAVRLVADGTLTPAWTPGGNPAAER